MLGHLYWDPDPVAFYLPVIHHPVVWYGICFAFAFFVGYYLLQFLFRRFLCFHPEITSADLLDASLDLQTLNEQLEKPVLEEFSPSLLLFFAKKWLSEKKLRRYQNRLLLEKKWGKKLRSLKAVSKQFAEQLTLYVVVGTVLGARLGHVLFYEKWGYYLTHPLQILKTWEGGLASHGAIVGITLSLIFFIFRCKDKYPMISVVRILDLLVIPSMYVAVMIRFGNFINQEILGKVSSAPFAIIFGSPADGGPITPRHPAQLYEATFYLISFLLFFRFFTRLLTPRGCLAGICLFSTFLFRFLVEFFKEEQSFYLSNNFLTMGQYLSIPFISLGLFLWMKSKSDLFKRSKRQPLV